MSDSWWRSFPIPCLTRSNQHCTTHSVTQTVLADLYVRYMRFRSHLSLWQSGRWNIHGCRTQRKFPLLKNVHPTHITHRTLISIQTFILFWWHPIVIHGWQAGTTHTVSHNYIHIRFYYLLHVSAFRKVIIRQLKIHEDNTTPKNWFTPMLGQYSPNTAAKRKHLTWRRPRPLLYAPYEALFNLLL